ECWKRPLSRCATRRPVSRSGRTTWCTPTRVRMRAWASESALAQMSLTPSSTRLDAVRIEASRLLPMPMTTCWKSFTPSCLSASGSVASAMNESVRWGSLSCSSFSSTSMPRTSTPWLWSSSAMAEPNRPSPMIATGGKSMGRALGRSLSSGLTNVGPFCRIGVVLARGSGGERCAEGDGSDAAHEHEDAEEDLRGTAEVSGDAGGEADGGEGGDDLEMDLGGAVLRVEGTEARDNECYDTYCHSTDSESLADHGVINATTADDSIFFTPNFCHDRREHHEERGDLQATCGTAGSASNEHQNVGTHQGIGRHLAKVHGPETSGTGRNGLKHCRQGSIPAAQPGECMITLERPEHHEATDEEHRGAVESDPSGHRQPRWFPPLPAQAHPRDELVEHRKAEPAEDKDRKSVG